MDVPFRLPDAKLQVRLLATMDVEEKIPRALRALAPFARRRVLLLDSKRLGFRARQLRVMGATVVTRRGLALEGLRPASFDVVVACWAGFGGTGPGADAALRAAEPLLVPGGRLLAVQEYGRDDVRALSFDGHSEAELVAWSHRHGPLLTRGWRVRTLHCWWTFADLGHATRLLSAAFPDTGPAVAAAMRRPRLSHKVAVYHLTPGEPGDEEGEEEAVEPAPGAAGGGAGEGAA